MIASGTSISPSASRLPINQAEAIDYQVTPSLVALLERLGASLAITN